MTYLLMLPLMSPGRSLSTSKKIYPTSEATIITEHGDSFLPQGMRIDVCMTVRCHLRALLIRLGEGVNQPKFLSSPKTFPLIEGNVMTCVTCHEPHGGELKYMLRKRAFYDGYLYRMS